MKQFLFNYSNIFTKCLVSSCLSGIVLCGCVGFSGTGGPGSNLAPRLKAEVVEPRLLRSVNSVLVSPLILSRDVRSREGVAFPFYSELYRTASQELSLELLGGSDFLNTHYSQVGHQDLLAKGLDVSKASGQDGLLLTEIHRFVEREGTQVGATRFASLHFTMRLYRSSDAKEVWRASYHFRDRPLSENIFGLGDRIANHDKPGWRRADAALEKGFREAFRNLSLSRVKAFEG